MYLVHSFFTTMIMVAPFLLTTQSTLKVNARYTLYMLVSLVYSDSYFCFCAETFVKLNYSLLPRRLLLVQLSFYSSLSLASLSSSLSSLETTKYRCNNGYMCGLATYSTNFCAARRCSFVKWSLYSGKSRKGRSRLAS